MSTAFANDPFAHRERPADIGHRQTATFTSLPISAMQPPRLNFTGHCVMCFRHGCDSDRCREQYENAEWEICRTCDGSGLDAIKEQICTCIGGLVDMANSEWPRRPVPRPPRLNFAGFCIWCDDRWCDNERCIDRHPRSVWMVCDWCHGRGRIEPDQFACGCSNGLTEAAFTGS